jgi:hypothetical protein
MRSWCIFLIVVLNSINFKAEGFRAINRFVMSTEPIKAINHPTKMFQTASRKAIQVGLTGSIGMGKSAVAGHFRALGFKVFDADAAVHRLYATGGSAVEPIRKVLSRSYFNSEIGSPCLLQHRTYNTPLL